MILEENNKIEIMLQCFICLQRLQDPYQCAFCSKPTCRHCIEQWLLIHGTCPICKQELGNQIQPPNMVKSNILADVLDYKIDKCKQHSQEMEFFCTDCNQVVCKICAIVDNHKKHEIILATLKAEQKKKVKSIQRIQNQLSSIQKTKSFKKLQTNFNSKLLTLQMRSIKKFMLQEDLLQKQVSHLIKQEEKLSTVEIEESKFQFMEQKVQSYNELIEELRKNKQETNLFNKIQSIKECNIDRINPPSQQLKFTTKLEETEFYNYTFSIWDNNGKLTFKTYKEPEKTILIIITFQMPIECRLVVLQFSTIEKDTIDEVYERLISFTPTQLRKEKMFELKHLSDDDKEINFVILLSPLTYYNYSEQMMYYMWRMEQKLNELGYVEYQKLSNKKEFGIYGETIVKKLKQDIEKYKITNENPFTAND